MQVQTKEGDPPNRRGTKAYFAATAFAQVCALARYVLLARLLGPEQLGIAAILILTAQFFESISDSGSDRFLIQDPDGDHPRVQAMVQGVFIIRGVCTALSLVIIAVPFATFYHMPALVMGLVVLAASPLISGFLHLDLRRAQRRSDFRVEGVAMLASELGSLIVTVAACLILRDFTAVAYGLVAKSIITVLVSHLCAERPYRVGYSAQDARRLALFAAPLMANGLLLFVGSQGDRLLVAHQLGVTALGQYSAIMLLIFYPAAMMSRYVGAIHLPLISVGQHKPGQLQASANALGGQTTLLAMAMSAGFALVAPFAVVYLYGRAFSLPATTICLIGLLQTSRFIRLWPTTVALGLGKSSIVLSNNIVRLIGLALAVVGGALNGLPGLLIGLILGELASLAAGLLQVNSTRAVPPTSDFDRFCAFVGVGLITFATVHVAGRPTAAGFTITLIAAVLLIGFVLRRERATIALALEFLRRQVSRR